jgi:hypothetical protein
LEDEADQGLVIGGVTPCLPIAFYGTAQIVELVTAGSDARAQRYWQIVIANLA